jgi:hypothetical protein
LNKSLVPAEAVCLIFKALNCYNQPNSTAVRLYREGKKENRGEA